MILCIDSGNTRLKWGIHDGDSWRATGALLQTELLRLTATLPRDLPITQVMVSNVAGNNAADVLRAVLPGPRDRVQFVQSEAEALGVRNGYKVPVQLGVDRWCGLLGARSLTPHACVVVSAGTATTIDTLTAEGDFLGGLILPGFDLMRTTLSRNTAQLPLADGHWEATPRSTADAIVSGCLEAQLGAIERAFARIASAPGALCILAGGAAPRIAPHLACPHRVAEGLVLEGLRCLAAESPAA